MEVMSTGHNDYIIARSSSSSNSNQYTLFQKYSESCPSYYQDVKNTGKYFVIAGSKQLVYENINILTRPVCQIDTNIDTTVDYTYTDYQPLTVCETYVSVFQFLDLIIGKMGIAPNKLKENKGDIFDPIRRLNVSAGIRKYTLALMSTLFPRKIMS